MSVDQLPARTTTVAATGTPNGSATRTAAPRQVKTAHTVSKGDVSLSRVLGVFVTCNAVAGAAGYALFQIAT
ncbi:hypothetical protein AB0J14_04910 [Micromonospora arborensis]|uniref:hypothetical protein n=1 Tax=Micromonospora arborensis TaxID=2116518 RepID=UPI0033D6EC03